MTTEERRRLVKQASELFNVKDYLSAEVLFGKLLEAFPSAPEIKYYFAVCLANRGEKTKALEYLIQAITLDPELSKGLLEAGKILGDLGRSDEAIRMLSNYLALERGSFKGYALRGLNHKIVGMYDKALEDFNAAIRCNNTDGSLFLWRSQINLLLNRPQDAANDMEESKKLL